MLTLSPSPSHQPSLIWKWVRGLIWVTLLTVELTLSTATPIAVIGTGISPWSIWAKIESGIVAPAQLIRHIQSLPKDMADTEKLMSLIEKPWTVEKVRELMTVGKELLSSVYIREKTRMSDLIWGARNYHDMPAETLSAMIVVLMLYYFTLQWVRLLRLWDRDTGLDSMRKQIARSLGSNQQVTNMSDEQIVSELERLMAEQQRRGVG